MQFCFTHILAVAADAGAIRWESIGRWHVAVVHIPVAMLIVAGLIEAWRMFTSAQRLSAASIIALVVGAIGAAAAAGSGWLLAAGHSYAGAQASLVESHRWLGMAAGGMALVALLLALLARNRRGGVLLGAHRLSVIATAVVAGLAGHLGGSLVHGPDFLALPRESAPVTTAVPASQVRLPADGKIDFAKHVQPILVERCIDCHGADVRRGALRLDLKAAALAGGKSGPSILPGDSEKSPFIRRILGQDNQPRMPLDEEPLTGEQTRILRAWIAQGAAWADDKPATATDLVHWAYVRPVRPNPPPVRDTNWPANSIDYFVLARLEQEGLAPSPEAERETLLRRVSLDLVGLPPTPEEARQFLSDPSPLAYERLVDRLLASTQYGERWARPWLDLARYADTNGYEKDRIRSMWPYRDWVIDALNRDMSFDEFTIEQLAGDLLPAPTQSQLIATGFHRNTMLNEEGGVDPEEYRYNVVVDRVNTTATTWLGTTLSCAQCHDHKYDPFSLQDYYRVYAIFNNTAPETDKRGGTDPSDISPRLELRFGRYDELELKASAMQARLDFVTPADHNAFLAEQVALKALRDEQARNRATTLVMRELPTPRPARVHLRGAFDQYGEAVEPGTPRILGPLKPDMPRNRLGLARWLVDPDNPLTARVTVNRIWEQYFGLGLVRTSEDFGTQSEPPSHPQLLDWLATEFIRQKWSQKAIHRLIVTSATYRQSSHVTPQLLERDPANRLLARGPRLRLEAELIRDQALRISGLLSLQMGGPSVFPYQPDGIWAVVYSGDQWSQSTGEDQYRRGIYTFWRRSAPYPAFVNFDAPSREGACTRRPRTNTPLQALTTLNDPAFVEAAGALAGRILRESGPKAPERIRHAFRLCLVRDPRPAEADRLIALYNQQLANYKADAKSAEQLVAGKLGQPAPAGIDRAELAAWTVVCNVLLNLDETLTRE